jgi:hypothetical protein
MLNTTLIKEHFVISNDMLYRLRADGTVTPVKTVAGGRLFAKVHGCLYKGPEIAWVLIYGTSPMFPISLLSLDPTDMREENLVPIRGRRLRFRAVESGRGFRHAHSDLFFLTREACYADWVSYARRHYSPDILFAVQQERLRDRDRVPPVYIRPKKAPTHTGRTREDKPPRPQPIEGRLWYWYANQWVSVPPACHCSDDYIKRCEWTLKGATSFQFNAVTEMVEPIYPTV